MVEQLRERWPLVLWALLLCGAVVLAFPHAMSALYLEAGGRAMDEPAQAVAHLQKAIAWDGANSQAYRFLAQAYLALGQPDAAIDALTQAQALRPKNPLLHMELADAYLAAAQGRQPSEAPDLYQKIAREWELAGLTPARIFYQGEQSRKTGHLDEALKWFERAMWLEPGVGDAWFFVGLVRRDLGDWDGALDAYQTAAESPRLIRVDLGEIFYRIGNIYQWEVTPTQPQKALVAYQTAIEKDDFHDTSIAADCYYRLGQVQSDLGYAIEEYRTSFQKAVELNPTHAWAHIRFGIAIYRETKDLAHAEQEIKKAIKVDWQNKWAYYHLGTIYEQEGLFDESAKCYRQALAIDSEFDQARTRLATLESP